MSLTDELLKRFTHHLEINERVLAALYVQIQRREADKVPGKWQPYTVLVLCPTAGTQVLPLQILRDEARRNTLAIVNYGTDDCLIGNEPFDPVSILQQWSDPNNPNTVLPAPNQVVKIGFLPAGGTISIESHGGVWAYNVNTSSIAGASGALLTIVENLYQIPRVMPAASGVSTPTAGLAWEGYTDNGAKVLR